MSSYIDMLSRNGIGLTVWRYPEGDDMAMMAAKEAASDNPSRAHLFVPCGPGDLPPGETHHVGVRPCRGDEEADLTLLVGKNTVNLKYISDGD